MEEARRVAEVAHVDSLVGPVDQRHLLVDRHVAVGEEPVGQAVGEGVAKPARVGEAGQHRGHQLGRCQPPCSQAAAPQPELH